MSTNSLEVTRYLSFSLGDEDYALPLLRVKEVIAPTQFTSIPFAPSYFAGIMNLRGSVISVIDLRKKFGIASKQGKETVVIVCDVAPLCLGVIVDSVNLVLPIKASEISERPDVENSFSNEFITGVYRLDKKLVLLLDIYKSLNIEDLSALKGLAAA